MSSGELLTRGSVWLALSLYTAGEIARTSPNRSKLSRYLNSLGCAAFLAHVAFAFQFHHHWSHEAAYEETARQSAELIGWRWGGGLYLNYAFAAIWTFVAIAQWNGSRLQSSARWLVRGFFFFMILNGAVIFAKSPMRWFGLLLCVILAACWWPRHNPTE